MAANWFAEAHDMVDDRLWHRLIWNELLQTSPIFRALRWADRALSSQFPGSAFGSPSRGMLAKGAVLTSNVRTMVSGTSE